MRRENPQQDLFIEAPIWYENLTRKQKLFVEAYCTDRTCFLNATAAYIKVYGVGKEITNEIASPNAARLLRNPLVKDAVGRLLKARQAEEDRLSEYQVLNVIKTLTTYNPADIIDVKGKLKCKDLSELGPLAMCISGIKQTKSGLEIKLYDRTKTAALLAQYLDLIRPMEIASAVTPMVGVTPKEVMEVESGEYKIIGQAAGEASAETAENDQL